MDNQDQNCRYMTFIWTQELEFPKYWENKYDCLLFWGDLTFLLVLRFTCLRTEIFLPNYTHLIIY